MRRSIGMECVAAILLAVSKYFLLLGDPVGWVLSVVGFVVSGMYLWSLRLPISVVIQCGMLCLSGYGWWKRSHGIAGLTLIDYGVILITLVVVIRIAREEWQRSKPLWLYEVVAVCAGMAGFLLLAFGVLWGWFCVLMNLLVFTYIFVYKKSYIFVITQTATMVVIVYWLSTGLLL